MRNRSHFGHNTSTFICQVCTHKTRDTGHGDDRFCEPCYDLYGIQNSLWDNGPDYFKSSGLLKARDEIVAQIAKRGGDLAKVRAEMPDLFAVEADEP